MEEKIIEALQHRKNVILHGPGGTGKTYCLRTIAGIMTDLGKVVGCTATTGIAALNLNVPEKKIAARTLHSWAGVGLAHGSARKLLGKVKRNTQATARWTTTNLLIVDEVSMLGMDFFTKLDYIGRAIRRNSEKPFGGLQILFSGDFLQLPPVKDDWVFKSEPWKELCLVPFIFEIPKRYDDNDYFELLLRIREGDQTEKDIKKLKARCRSYRKLQKILAENESENIIRPTILYSRKVDVEYYNETELSKLPGRTLDFIADDTFVPLKGDARYETYMGLLDDAIPKVIPLKVGAQVMLKCNLDVAGGLVNGSRGVVLEIESDFILVRFINGITLNVEKYTWVIQDKYGIAKRTQFPFILAWSLTIHKSQGATLDYVICDLGPSVFDSGQAYVALSRVRNLRGLFVCEFYPPSIKVSKTALKYSRKLKEIEGQYEIGEDESEEETDGDDDFCVDDFAVKNVE